MPQPGQQLQEAQADRRHESDIRHARPIWIAAAIFVVALAAVHVAVWFVLLGYQNVLPDRSAAIPPALTTPSLQHWTHPQQDLAQLQAQQRARLQGYAWVDRQSGIVRIPLERAMELLPEYGWRAVATPEAQSAENAAGGSE